MTELRLFSAVSKRKKALGQAARSNALRSGAPGEIRTPDPLLRRQTLYPTELRARGAELPQFTALFEFFATGN